MNTYLASVLLGYVSGSIPTAVWISRLVGGIDIRRQGSGNAGATNVARVLGTGWGLLVGLMDTLKGLLPVWFLAPVAAKAMGIANADAGLAIGAAAIIGHLYPLFAGFRGGKGVLTALGMSIALMPLEAVCGLAVWGIVFALTRIVSLGSIIACLSVVAVVFVRRYVFGVPHPMSLLIAAVLIAALVIVMHRSNIRRLLRGEEHRFGKKPSS